MDSLTGLIMDSQFDFNDTKAVVRGFAIRSGRHPDDVRARYGCTVEV